MSDSDESTVPVSRQEAGEVVETSLELHLRGVDGRREVVPFHRNVMEFEVGLGRIRFTYLNREVLFRNLKVEEPVYKDGEMSSSGRLEVGSSLEVGGYRVLLWDQGQPSAYLKGYSPPYSGELWPLGPGEHRVGRPGKRMNEIRLDHPTVSRQHATIVGEQGTYRLRAESSSFVCVGGVSLEQGAEVKLSHGDMVEFGQMVVRFHSPATISSDCDLILVRSMGGFQVLVGGSSIADKDWKTQQTKWMFACLAYHWGRPVALEVVADQLWPDLTPEKARNNLNTTVSTLRQTLRSRLPESIPSLEVVMRSSSTLQLNPDFLDQHDVVRLQRHLHTAAQEKSGPLWELQAERAVMEYSGPFLHDCYLDWVLPIRQALELEVTDLGQQLLQWRASQQQWEAVVPLATQLMRIDPYSSAVCLNLMQALSAVGAAHQAVKVYEQYKQVLYRDLSQEPEVELQREYCKAQMLS